MLFVFFVRLRQGLFLAHGSLRFETSHEKPELYHRYMHKSMLLYTVIETKTNDPHTTTYYCSVLFSQTSTNIILR